MKVKIINTSLMGKMRMPFIDSDLLYRGALLRQIWLYLDIYLQHVQILQMHLPVKLQVYVSQNSSLKMDTKIVQMVLMKVSIVFY
jgi:hypothetical protein